MRVLMNQKINTVLSSLCVTFLSLSNREDDTSAVAAWEGLRGESKKHTHNKHKGRNGSGGVFGWEWWPACCLSELYKSPRRSRRWGLLSQRGRGDEAAAWQRGGISACDLSMEVGESSYSARQDARKWKNKGIIEKECEWGGGQEGNRNVHRGFEQIEVWMEDFQKWSVGRVKLKCSCVSVTVRIKPTLLPATGGTGTCCPGTGLRPKRFSHGRRHQHAELLLQDISQTQSSRKRFADWIILLLSFSSWSAEVVLLKKWMRASAMRSVKT